MRAAVLRAERRRRSWPTVLAFGFGSLLLAGVVVQTGFAAARPGLFASGHNVPNAVVGVIGDGVGEILVGMVLASRLPANPLGWLLLGFGASTELLTGGAAIAQAGYGPGHPSLLSEVSLVGANLAQIGILATVVLIVALFPTGRIDGRGRRILLRVFWLTLALLAVPTLLTPKLTAGSGQQYPNPLGVSDAKLLSSIGNGGGALLFVVFLVVFAVDAIRRWLRAQGAERQQLKLLGYAAVGWVVVLVCGNFISTSSTWSSVGWAVGSNLVAIAIGTAVLRYRLYDLDRIVSRTVSYTLLTGLLIGIYVGLVALGTRVMPFSSPVAIAGSTLAAAALFNPLRRRVQHGVDRRFNRARYNAQATAAAFGERLRAAVDLDRLRQDLTAVVNATLEPEQVSLWLANTPAIRSDI